MTLQQGRTGLRCAKIGRHSEGCDSYGVQTSRLSRELFPLDRSSCLRQRAFRNSALTVIKRCERQSRGSNVGEHLSVNHCIEAAPWQRGSSRSFSRIGLKIATT